jgi:hypothetical protein
VARRRKYELTVETAADLLEVARRTQKARGQRCGDPNNKRFADYGGRGIRVCARWREFANFYSDMGPRPSDVYSIDRINNDGNYEPSNCRWATAKEQRANQRKPMVRA